MKKYLLILGIVVNMFWGVGLLTAAEDDPAVNVDEALEYTYGSVVSASAAEVVISEYNYESDEEIQMTYVVNADTKFSNVNAAQDLLKDDNVDIYYKVIDDRKIATMITKDDTVYEEDPEGAADENAADGVDTLNDLPGNTVELPEDTGSQNMLTGNETKG